MDPFKLLIIIAFLVSVVLQSKQFHDFSETRSLVIEALYMIIIIALATTTDFLAWL